MPQAAFLEEAIAALSQMPRGDPLGRVAVNARRSAGALLGAQELPLYAKEAPSGCAQACALLRALRSPYSPPVQCGATAHILGVANVPLQRAVATGKKAGRTDLGGPLYLMRERLRWLWAAVRTAADIQEVGTS